ncbi:hypothetical protein [Thiothrix nivea]|uniref:Uncharacterized protein n=1 Tax=Thiothrix nivea (strain ATCC 35100 / DSM 5205 / JP2) TaxID=870187 RepID=A0A656HL74_THINJ|nr:hypothetical protein [Thiothrix nivea]EIJ36992.1 hypothetical protein Thini_4521 [Thiothrix nivea DSM 5205]
MSKDLNLKNILLTKLNNLLNPNLHKKIIWGLFSTGALLVATPILKSLFAKVDYTDTDRSVTFEIAQSDNEFWIWIGVFFIIMAVALFIKDKYFSKEQPSEFLGISYYICKNYELLLEISKNDLSKFPIDDPIFFETTVFDSLKEIINQHPYPYRRCGVDGDKFPSVEEYIKAHSDALPPNKNDGQYSYFEIVRKPKINELEKIKHEDGVLQLMLNGLNTDLDGISLVGCYQDGCGGEDGLYEEYIFRELWCVFLAIENTHDKPLKLNNITSEIIQNPSFSSFKNNGKENNLILPEAIIKPG